MSNSQNGRPGHTEHNAQGQQAPTQRNEGRRTPESRNDRGDQRGGTNQHQMRRGQGARQG